MTTTIFLPVQRLLVTSIEGVLNGCSAPLLVRAEGPDDPQFVLKLLMSQDQAVSPDYLSCARELICYQLARLCGVRVPDPAILFFPRALYDESLRVASEITRDANFHLRLSSNPLGPHFGSRYIGRGLNLTSRSAIRNNEEAQNYLDVLIFDLLVWNGDRRIQNTNLREHNGAVYAIDFGMAQMPTPFVARPLLPLDAIRAHAAVQPLRRWVKAQRVPVPVVPVHALTTWQATVTHAAIEELVASVPVEWNVPPTLLAECATFLLERVRYVDHIQRMLNEVLVA